MNIQIPEYMYCQCIIQSNFCSRLLRIVFILRNVTTLLLRQISTVLQRCCCCCCCCCWKHVLGLFLHLHFHSGPLFYKWSWTWCGPEAFWPSSGGGSCKEMLWQSAAFKVPARTIPKPKMLPSPPAAPSSAASSHHFHTSIINSSRTEIWIWISQKIVQIWYKPVPYSHSEFRTWHAST